VDNDELQDMLARWIINHQRPFTIIEDSELIAAFELCNPNSNLGKRDAMKNRILKLYDDYKKEMKVRGYLVLLFRDLRYR